MNLLSTTVLAAADPHHAGEGGIAESFGLSLSGIIAQVVLFLIVYLILKKFAFGPIQGMLEERRNTIADAQANAAKIREELTTTEKRIDEMLVGANSESQKMINDAKESADKVGEQRKQQAIAEAQTILDKAAKAAEAERNAAMAELKADFGRLVVATTSKVTGKELTSDDQERISKETASELAQ